MAEAEEAPGAFSRELSAVKVLFKAATWRASGFLQRLLSLKVFFPSAAKL